MLGEEIVQGFEREDGTRELLAPDDLARYFIAQERLIRESVRIARRVFQPAVSQTCLWPLQCYDGLGSTLMRLQTMVDIIASPDPFTSVHTVCKNGFLCPHCLEMLGERNMAEMRAVWEKLPMIFKLDR